MTTAIAPNGSDLSSRSTEFITATLENDSDSSSATDAEQERDEELDRQRRRELFLRAKASAKAADIQRISLDPLKNNDQLVLFDQDDDEASDHDQYVAHTHIMPLQSLMVVF